MIWPFKPRAPLPLLQKVIVEKCLEAAVQVPGINFASLPDPVRPDALQPLFDSVEKAHLPGRLTEYFQTRMPVSVDVVEWAEQNEEYVLHRTEDEVRLTVRSEYLEYPELLSAVLLSAMSELITSPLGMNGLFGVNEILPSLFGFGAILSNATLYDVADQDQQWEIWQVQKRGHMSSVEHGYAMAICDTYLNTSYGEYLDSFRQDASETYLKGVRFLQKTGDVCLTKEFPRTGSPSVDDETVRRLSTGSDTVILSTLIDAAGKECSDSVAVVTGQLLGHRESCVRRAAIEVLKKVVEIPRDIHDELVSMVEFEPQANRLAALATLRAGYPNDADNRKILFDVMGRTEIRTRNGCLMALNQLTEGEGDEDWAAPVLSALGSIAPHVSSEMLSQGLELLSRVTADPVQALEDRFRDEPTERAILLEALGEYQSSYYLGSDDSHQL